MVLQCDDRDSPADRRPTTDTRRNECAAGAVTVWDRSVRLGGAQDSLRRNTYGSPKGAYRGGEDSICALRSSSWPETDWARRTFLGRFWCFGDVACRPRINVYRGTSSVFNRSANSVDDRRIPGSSSWNRYPKRAGQRRDVSAVQRAGTDVLRN